VASPQTGIFALGTAAHAYLEFDLLASVDGLAVVASVARLREPRTTIGGVNLVAGFRLELWAVVAPDAAPVGVVGFKEPIRGVAVHELPATQHDVVVWVAGASYDVVFDSSRSIVAALMGRATLAHEMVGWQYHHDRDLTGFEDGSENPSIVEATSVALVPSGQPGGGCVHPAPPAMGARCDRLGSPAGRVAGGDHRSPEVGQPGTGPTTADLPRQTHGSGSVRQDLPAERGLRDRVAARDHLRRLLREPGTIRADARKHGRPRV